MNRENKHIELNNNSLPEDFFREMSVPFSNTKEEAWNGLEAKLAEKPAGKVTRFNSRRLAFGIAATILLLAGVMSLLRFYTKSVICPPGQHLSCQLPDGSRVDLNADSRIAYHPLWWMFSREVRFEGEGFFQVQKGKKFSVISATGRTEVLGTSFNIYSREDEYRVTCITGKVRVISFAKAETVLAPDYSARMNPDGELTISRESNAGDSHAWVDNMFRFTSMPLILVLNEIERQYDIRITLKAPVEDEYTGYFTRNRSLEETLNLVCTPFGLKFARISEKEYEIFQN
jgi:transmembrane sensor